MSKFLSQSSELYKNTITTKLQVVIFLLNCEGSKIIWIVPAFDIWGKIVVVVV